MDFLGPMLVPIFFLRNLGWWPIQAGDFLERILKADAAFAPSSNVTEMTQGEKKLHVSILK